MDMIKLGRTGLMVSASSFGALPVQRVSMDEAKSCSVWHMTAVLTT